MTKAVRFAEDKTEVHLIEHLSEIEGMDLGRRWISATLMEEERKNDRLCLAKIKKGMQVEDFDIRGLEATISNNKSFNKMDVVLAVLDAQQRLRTASAAEQEEELSMISRKQSHDCRKKARKMGTADASFIPEIAARMAKEKQLKKQQKQQQEQQQQQTPSTKKESSQKATQKKSAVVQLQNRARRAAFATRV